MISETGTAVMSFMENKYRSN